MTGAPCVRETEAVPKFRSRLYFVGRQEGYLVHGGVAAADRVPVGQRRASAEAGAETLRRGECVGVERTFVDVYFHAVDGRVGRFDGEFGRIAECAAEVGDPYGCRRTCRRERSQVRCSLPEAICRM